MIDEITHRQLVKTSYYDDITRISNSNIGWFLNKGPAYLHSMLEGKSESATGAQLARGTMIHEYLLQPEEFQKDYVVWNKSRPSSAQQEKFCQELAQSVEIEPNKAVLSAFKTAYKVGGRSEEKMLSEGLKIAPDLKDYIDWLKNGDNRTQITPYDANQLMQIAENIQQHKLAKELLKTEGINGDVELFHEFHINWEFEKNDIHVPCKSLLDSVCFDFKNKKCILMDLKTTVHISCFEESMNQYDYLRQLCYYTMAIWWYLENERKEDTSKWSIEWYIIGIDTTGTNEIRVFQFEDKQIESRFDTITKALIDIGWHNKNNLWEHTREYYEGNGAEKLNL